MKGKLSILTLISTLVLTTASQLWAQSHLNAGDILVTDVDPPGIGGRVVKTDPASGGQTLIATGGSFRAPAGLTLDGNGNIIVTDAGLGGVIKVEPSTGAQTVVSSGGNLVAPGGVAIDANGNLLISDAGCRCILKVDPLTGAQSTLTSGQLLSSPHGLDL